MSDNTTSARPPIILSNLSGASSLRKSSCAKLTPGISGISRTSMATTSTLAHHPDQQALSEAAIGDAQPWQRKRIADRIEDGAAGQHQIGALDADAIVGGALLIAHAEQARDGRGDISVAHPDAIDPPAVVSGQIELNASQRRHGAGGAEQVHIP